MSLVLFDYDSARIRDGMGEVLAKHLRWLQKEAEEKVQIEGHCDERGTEEYNLSLGEARARAVELYLLKRGVSRDRMHTISWGESRPIAEGHSEEAWKWNRRVMLYYYKD